VRGPDEIEVRAFTVPGAVTDGPVPVRDFSPPDTRHPGAANS
jgi:hypothetical protein